MDRSIKLKNVYNIQYNTHLTIFSVFLVGLIALWIAIFVQSDPLFFTMQYKLLITATIINSIILSLIILNKLRKEIEEKISN